MASELIVQTIQGPSSGANANKVIIPSGQTLDVSGGSLIPEAGQILQLKQVQWDTTTAMTAIETYVAVNDSAITITARGDNSHFYLLATGNAYQDAGVGMNLGFYRGSTLIRGVTGSSGDAWIGGGNGGSTNSFSIAKTFVDEPAVSAGTSLTYKVAFGRWSSSGTTWLNYDGYNGTASNFTIMEIAQ